jgi:hypothetical protein
MGAKQSCPAIFGIPYNDSNKNVKKIMNSLQDVINKLQEIACTTQLKYVALDMVNNMDEKGNALPAADIKKAFEKDINNMTENEDYLKKYNISKEQYDQLKNVISALINVLISVNTDPDGKIYPKKIKQTVLDILNSLCLNYKAPARAANPSTLKSTFGSMVENDCSLWIFLLIVVLLVVLYIYHENKDVIKFPTFKQRMAEFGRSIKSIRSIH